MQPGCLFARAIKRIAAIPEPLGYDTEAMFSSYDFPNLTMLRLQAWKIRLAVEEDVGALRVWETSDHLAGEANVD